MRLSQTPPTLLSLLLVATSHTNPVIAGPYPKDDLHDLGYSFLQDRDCASYCGVDNQYCCTAGQACYTNVQNIAYCSAETAAAVLNTGAAGVPYSTSTWTETDLVARTSTYYSYYVPATTVYTPAATSVAPAICTPSAGESSCGPICCTSSQTCASSGKCQDIPEGGLTSWSYVASSTPSYSAPLRPTSGIASTATNTVSATTTQPFGTPVSASGSSIPITESSSRGLSSGAIAGIVIGVIAGVILLILICFCCVLRAGFDGLLAIFGLGNNRRRTTERVETVERYSRHGSGTASRRETHGGWFGDGGRATRVSESRKRKSSGLGGLGAVGAGLAGLALVLGLKRKHDKKEKMSSEISSSYYTDSYTGTSASSASSDRRTRQSRRH